MIAEFGLYLPQVRFSFGQILERVLLAERLRFRSVSFFDHLYSLGAPELPSFEAWTLVSALAPLTRTIRLGHLVLCNSFRHPALLAKMAISLDQISGGRLDLAMGTGSFPEEMAQFGIAFADARTRTRQLDEALRVIKLICTQSRSSFDGEFYQLRDAPNAPAPIQKPHPPIIIGGGGEKLTLPLVARHADIWNCPTYSLSEQARKIGVLRTECERIGRDPATLRMSEETVLVLARSPGELATALEEAQRRYAGAAWGLEAAIAGTPVEVIEQIRKKITLGIDYFIFFFHDRGRPETLELFASEVMPAFA